MTPLSRLNYRGTLAIKLFPEIRSHNLYSVDWIRGIILSLQILAHSRWNFNPLHTNHLRLGKRVLRRCKRSPHTSTTRRQMSVSCAAASIFTVWELKQAASVSPPYCHERFLSQCSQFNALYGNKYMKHVIGLRKLLLSKETSGLWCCVELLRDTNVPEEFLPPSETSVSSRWFDKIAFVSLSLYHKPSYTRILRMC